MSVLVRIKLLSCQPPYNSGEMASISPERLAGFDEGSYVRLDDKGKPITDKKSGKKDPEGKKEGK